MESDRIEYSGFAACFNANLEYSCYLLRYLDESGVGKLGSYERSARCHGIYTISHLSIFHKGFLSCLWNLDRGVGGERGRRVPQPSENPSRLCFLTVASLLRVFPRVLGIHWNIELS